MEPVSHTSFIYNVLKKQSEYLPGKTSDCIAILNKIYDDSAALIREHNPRAFILTNLGQDNFQLAFGIIKQDDERVFFYEEYELTFNDGTSFGIDEYEFVVPEHPTGDLFWLFRSEALDKLFYCWIIECVWNSKLMQLPLPLLYNDVLNLDTFTDLKTGAAGITSIDDIL